MLELTDQPADPVAAALADCSAALLKHAADALARGDKATSDRAFKLRANVDRIAADWRGEAPVRMPRARKDAA